MKRRVIMSALVLSVMGGVSAPAIADVVNAGNGHTYPEVCVLGSDSSNSTRDGICVDVPVDWHK